MDHPRSGGVRSLGRNTAPVDSSRGETATFARVAMKMREIQRRIDIERTMAVGELITNESLRGNRAKSSVRGCTNDTIRQLAGRSDCPLSKAALRRAVGIYTVLVSMPAIQTFGNISLRHIAVVLPLSAEDRRRVLEEAQREALSVRETKTRVLQLQRARRHPRSGASNAEHAVALADRGVREVAEAIARVTRSSDPSAATSDAVGSILSMLQQQVESLEDWANSPPSRTKRRSLFLVEGEEAQDRKKAAE